MKQQTVLALTFHRIRHWIRSNWITSHMVFMGKIKGGVGALLWNSLLRAIYLLPQMYLWRSLAGVGVDLGGFALPQLLTYTCVSAMLWELLNVRTPAGSWHYEGTMLDLYRRPQTVFGQLIAQTVGGWIPDLLLFALPMAVLLPLLGIRLMPASAWFGLSLVLSMALGFAIDFLFACFIIRMQNASWLAYVIRNAVTALFSGAIIPFALLPWGLGRLFQLLPFGSLAGAPLAMYVGLADPATVLPLQALWNLALWPLAFYAFQKSRERMVSYGG